MLLIAIPTLYNFIETRISFNKILKQTKKNREIEVKERAKWRKSVEKRLSKLDDFYFSSVQTFNSNQRKFEELQNGLDAHKVFATKSFTELSERYNKLDKQVNKDFVEDWKDKVIQSTNPAHQGGTLQRFMKNLNKITSFAIHKEMRAYFIKKGLSKQYGVKSIKDAQNLKETDKKLYLKEYTKAYQRLWHRRKAKNKQTK